MNALPKVVILHHCDELGGAGISLVQVCKMLKQHFLVKVYIPRAGTVLHSYLIENHVETCPINDDLGMISCYSGGPRVLSRTFAKSLLAIHRTNKVLRYIVETERPDIIAVNSMTLAWVGKALESYDIKSVCFVRETYSSNPCMGLIKRCLDEHFDGVIFISEFDKNKFNCQAPVTGVVRNCVHMENFSINVSRDIACYRLGLNSNKFNVLFVGGTSELKGWSVVAKSMLSLRDYPVDLVVAGSISHDRMSTGPNIRYIGVQSDISLAYRACDLLVFPSIAPHQARPAFEAGVMGLPVLISDFEETQEQVRDGVNGLTFLPGDSEDLAKKIVRLFTDRAMASQLGKANRDHAIEYHSFESCKKSLLSIISKVGAK